MLQKAVKVIERVQTRLSMRPVDVERSSPAIELPASSAISPGPEKPKMPEWYVSYAWGDDRTPEGRARKEIVDQLCDVAEAEGHHILRERANSKEKPFSTACEFMPYPTQMSRNQWIGPIGLSTGNRSMMSWTRLRANMVRHCWENTGTAD
jgi:hypothetical protein